MKGFETDKLVLYQPNEILQARVGAVEEFSTYIKQLQTVCSEFFATNKTPETLHVVVAVRPGKGARVWFISSLYPSADAQREPYGRNLKRFRLARFATAQWPSLSPPSSLAETARTPREIKT
jgi:hypothetical protein